METERIAGKLWGVRYVHHYRAVLDYDGKEHDQRQNGEAYVFAPTADEALPLFRAEYPDTKAYVVHGVNNNGGNGEVIFAARPGGMPAQEEVR